MGYGRRAKKEGACFIPSDAILETSDALTLSLEKRGWNTCLRWHHPWNGFCQALAPRK